jgi:hypothetical protein
MIMIMMIMMVVVMMMMMKLVHKQVASLSSLQQCFLKENW